MGLTPEQFKRVESIFESAGKLPRERWQAFVETNASDDILVRDEVLVLLSHDSEPKVDLNATPMAGLLAEYEKLAVEGEADRFLPDRIGSYRIIGRLGEGGFGAVFLAEQENPRREVALKVLRSPFASERTLKRFEYEAQILGRLQHPGIAQIFEAGTAQIFGHWQAFFAMEHVRGRSIREYCDAAGDPPRKLGTRERLDLFARVLDALHHAHLHGVIHRDLKPDNILVDQTGQPKILDFGVARIVSEDSNLTTMATGVGQLVGTLPYMSPEQVLGDPAAIDTRSDVYGAGVVLYELLTGCLPHDLRNRSILEATRAIREDEPTPLSARNRALRGEIQTIVGKSLEKNRERRYQSAAELADEIRRYLRGEPISAKRDSQWYVLRKTMRRYRVAVGVMLGFLVVVLAGLIVSLELLREATLARAKADKATQEALLSQSRAEHRFSQVREIAHQFLFDFHDEIRTIPGTTKARQKLVDTALQYVSSLTEDAAADPELQLELAEAYRKIGDAQGWPALANLGERDNARENYAKAAAILAAIVTDDTMMRRRTMVAGIRVQMHDADILHAMGQDVEARKSYREVIEGFELALSQQPRSPALREGLVVALINYSAALSRPSDLPERVQAIQRAETLLRQYIAEAPDIEGYEVQLTQVLVKLGRLSYSRLNPSLRDPEAAMRYFRSAVELAEARLQKHPQNIPARTMLGSARAGMVEILLARREWDEALRIARSVVDELTVLTQSDKADQRATEQLEAACDLLGEVYERRGELAEALQSYSRGLELVESAWRRDPSSRVHIRRTAVKSERLGRLCGQLRQTAACRAYYNRAIGLWADTQFEESSASFDEQRENLIAAYARYGTALIGLQLPREAAELVRRSADCFLEETVDSGDVECQLSATTAEVTIADYLVKIATESPEDDSWRVQLLREAIGRYERAAALQRAALQADPGQEERRALAPADLEVLRDFASAVASAIAGSSLENGGGSTVVELSEPGH
jgi:eukaryotic-like serine/threonine-protein kinase